MEKLAALWALFRQGEQVADPAKWNAHQITANMLGGAILALVHVAQAFGFALPVDAATADTVGAGVLAAVNVVLTVTTSAHVGLPAKPAVQGADDANA